MKALGIIGSRRKGGNTAVLVRAALDALEKEGVSTRAVFLEDYEINGCLGCEGCRDNYECVIRDGMQDLYPLILESDALVIGSPTHFYNISSVTSAFLGRCYNFEVFDQDDRSVWLSVNEALGGKYAVVIAVCEQQKEEDMGFTAEAMSMPLQALGYRVIETVKVLRLFEKGAALHDEQAVRQAAVAGEKLAKTLILRKETETRLKSMKKK
jgi:multimeric flavodoxin WrbA